MGLLNRTTFVIDKEGKIQHIDEGSAGSRYQRGRDRLQPSAEELVREKRFVHFAVLVGDVFIEFNSQARRIRNANLAVPNHGASVLGVLWFSSVHRKTARSRHATPVRER